MKGKKVLSKVLAVCLAAAMSLSLLAGVGSFASAATMTESVYVNKTIEIATGVRINITTYDDDNVATTKRFIPTDVNGTVVYPFITNGTTYLPVRAISNIFGATIDWNTFYSAVVIATSKTETVTNTNPAAVATTTATAVYNTVSAVSGVNIYVDNAEFIPTDVNGSKVDVLLIDGTTYLPVRAMTTIFGADIEWDSANYTATIVGAEATSSGDTEDLDDDDLMSILENMFSSLFSTSKIITFLSGIGAVREAAEDAFGITDIKDAINDMIDNLSADQMVKIINAWAEANNSTLDKLEEMFGVDNITDLIAQFKAQLESFVDGMDLPSLEDLFDDISSTFGLDLSDFDLADFFSNFSFDPDEFMTYLGSLLPQDIDFDSFIASVQEKIESGKTAIEAIKSVLEGLIPDISDYDLKTIITDWISAHPGCQLTDILEGFDSSSLTDLIATLREKIEAAISAASSSELAQMLENLVSGFDLSDISGTTLSDYIASLIDSSNSSGSIFDLSNLNSMIEYLMEQFSGQFSLSDLTAAIKEQLGSNPLNFFKLFDIDTLKDAFSEVIGEDAEDFDLLTAIQEWASANSIDFDSIMDYFNASSNSSLIDSVISAIKDNISNSSTTSLFSLLSSTYNNTFNSLADIFSTLGIG